MASALQAYVEDEISFWGLPGMTVALVTSDGSVEVLTSGSADTDRRLAVNPGHLFQIGSISKSMAAVALLTYVDEGRLVLEAPLKSYISGLALPAEPITVAQLLLHTAGLPADAPIYPRTPDGRLWCGFTPGSRFSYSNTGYVLLGRLIEHLGRAPLAEVLKRRVLDPLAMSASLSQILDRDRAAYAKGYAPLSTTRPFAPRQPLTSGPWPTWTTRPVVWPRLPPTWGDTCSF